MSPFCSLSRTNKQAALVLLWFLPLLCLCTRAELFILLSAILLHEGGHLAAFALTGEPCPRLFAVLCGLTFEPARPLPYRKELWIALAGPLANLSLALTTHFWCDEAVPQTALAAVHLLTALCNLLPVGGSDGARALFAALALMLPLRAAERTFKLLSFLSLAALAFALFYLLLSPGGGGALLLLLSLMARAATR